MMQRSIVGALPHWTITPPASPSALVRLPAMVQLRRVGDGLNRVWTPAASLNEPEQTFPAIRQPSISGSAESTAMPAPEM